MKLVIVESPAKCKKIQAFLGKDYIVKSSYGHFRDLKKKELGIDIDKDFKPTWSPSKIEDISDNIVLSHFKSLGKNDLKI